MNMSNRAHKGIVIVACGHSYYGRLSYNLALSIKSVDPLFPIAIIHSENSLSHLSEGQRKIFDHFVLLPGGTGFGCKLELDLLTPFEETLYLDADMAWMPKRGPAELFEELKDIEFTSITEGHTEDVSKKYYFWADPVEIKKVYEITGRIYQWRSEVMYFKKTDRVKNMFALARKVYKEPGLKSIIKFGNQVPDELAFNIACAYYDIHPHIYKWCPALWPRLHGNNSTNPSDIYNRYYLLSCGSNYATGDLKKLYNNIMKAACFKFKTQHVFPLMDKKSFIPDRQKM
jgi:hypothetical protein